MGWRNRDMLVFNSLDNLSVLSSLMPNDECTDAIIKSRHDRISS